MGTSRTSYRRKHDEHDHHEPEFHYGGADLEIDLGHCSREPLSSVLGGVAGGVIGSPIGKGDTQTATTAGGTVIGALIGGSIGRSMDWIDQACVGHVLEQAPHPHRSDRAGANRAPIHELTVDRVLTGFEACIV